MNNNKGIINLLWIITIFGVVALIFMFGLIFIKEAGDQFLGTPLTNTALSVLNNSPAPQNFSNSINTIQSTYDGIDLPYDLFFLIFWILESGGVFYLAYKVKKASIYSWIGMVFIGSMMFLLITGFVAQFTDWFIANFYDLLFSGINLSTPIMDFYFENMALINYLTFAIALFLNRIDVSIEMGGGRVEE